ncbi:MAG: hypothetical protein HYU69_01730 [Bacteroidetes bacterium]|nr:hypothetical protein [Bacteroidota bacterium]
MTPTEYKIQLATENFDKWVKLYASESAAKLKKRLRINHQQYLLAEKAGNDKAGELLNIMERIIIEARTYKAENNIPDTLSEIELAIADVETVTVKSDGRQEIYTEGTKSTKQLRVKKQTPADDDSQMSLF